MTTNSESGKDSDPKKPTGMPREREDKWLKALTKMGVSPASLSGDAGHA